MAEEARIYAADLATLTAIVRETPADVASLMLVGHNPGLAELALLLAASDASAGEDYRRMTQKYPTAALAVLAFPGDDWRVVPESCRLERFVTPKLLGGRDDD
jgi:phosphohistidine phosphatase